LIDVKFFFFYIPLFIALEFRNGVWCFLPQILENLRRFLLSTPVLERKGKSGWGGKWNVRHLKESPKCVIGWGGGVGLLGMVGHQRLVFRITPFTNSCIILHSTP